MSREAQISIDILTKNLNPIYSSRTLADEADKLE